MPTLQQDLDHHHVHMLKDDKSGFLFQQERYLSASPDITLMHFKSVPKTFRHESENKMIK